MADKGLVEEEGAASFWPFLEELPRTNPQWATEAINSYLARVTEDIDFKNIPMRFMPGRSTGGIRFLLDTAKAAPLAFLKVAIPFFLRVVTETADKRARELYSDSVWHIRMFREDQSEMESAFLKALEISLCQLARTSRPEFERLFERLRSYGDYDSVNYLLVRALTVAPSDSADLTVEYVLENLQRLEAGWIGIRNSQYWAARELIEHCSKTCSEKSYSRLQEAMLQHYPLWEKSRDGHRYNGYWQFIMLDALDRERRSEAVEIRIRELQRKFQPKVLKPLTLPQGGIVESPIDETLVRKMSDEQWLRAMNIYDKKDGSSQRSSRSFLAGGARELAAELEKETNHNPERFARLVLRMPVGLQPCYFQAILRGLGGAPIDKDLVFDVVRTVFGLEGKPGGHWLLGPIESLSGEDIPEDILKIVGWLATEADDPRLSEVVITAVKGSEPTSPSEILNAAINSTRGSAAVGMGSLLFDCSNRVPFFLPYIRRMVCDPTVIVRSAVANTLLGLFRHDEERAVELFLQLVEIDVDELFATPYVDKFLYYASYRHFTRLMPVIRRMLDSRSGFVREAGARQACLAQFDNPEALDLVVECISGDDDKRTGAAKVAAANVSNEKCRDFSHSALVRFFDDPIKEVRAEAASFFQKVEGRQLEACRRLIRAFLASRAFSENMEVLIRSLERSTANIPEELLAACEAIVTELDRCGWNMRYRTLAHAGTICELVLRAYRQSRDDGYRTRCLDLIDRLVGLEVYGIEEELREFER